MRCSRFVKMLILTTISWMLLCALTPAPLSAQESPPEPFLIEDINANTLGSGPGDYTDVDGTVFFTADDHVHGRELWRMDATSGGAVLVKDIYPGEDGSFPSFLTVFHGRLYFMADDGVHGNGLWTSDGTAAGTKLLKDIYPGSFFPMDDYIYFWADDGVHGQEVWRTDGTSDGTILVKDIRPGPESSKRWDSASQFVQTSVGVFFAASDGVHGEELWVTNGESSGTTLVADIRTGAESSNVHSLFSQGEFLFFTADDGIHGPELWAATGDPVNAFLVADIRAGAGGSDPSDMFTYGDYLMFTADDGNHGAELWRSDGTTAGTELIKDIKPGADTAFSWLSPPRFTQYAGDIYFVADDGTHGFELWKTDGTNPGTALVKDILPGAESSRISSLVVYHGKLMFTANTDSLWRTDGSPEHTALVKEMPGAIYSALYVINDVIVFIAQTEAEGVEVWRSDGTAAGTETITNVNIPGGSTNSRFYPADDRLFFNFYDDLHGKEPWFTDGTAAGTALFEDVNDNETDDAWPCEFVSLDGAMLFSAEDGNGDRWLWRSNGTPGDVTQMSDVAQGPEALIEYGGQIFFFASDPEHGQELWKTDGTAEGTALLRDIAPGTDSSLPGFGYRWSARTDSLVFFNANDGVHGDEVWRSDGTTEGTYMVRDINPNGSGLDALIVNWPLGIGNLLFFVADDGVHGRELWRSDGTPDGTYMVKDINPGPENSLPGNFVEFQDVLYFSAADPEHSAELWRSDGTPEGTYMVKDIAPGTRGAFYWESHPAFTVAGGLLFFGADDSVHGMELWKSDGTPEGTAMVKDIAPGSDRSMVTAWHRFIHFAEMDGVLYFPATTGHQDVGLWRSDGTADGTYLILDVTQNYNTFLTRLTHIGQWLYFWLEFSQDGTWVAELWRSDGSDQNVVQLGTFGDSPQDCHINALYPITHADVALFDADDGQLGHEVWGLQINQAPAPVSDQYTIDEDATLTVDTPGILANDSDPDGDDLTVSLVEVPAHGTAALSADGSFVYTPTANFNGVDTLTYACSDDHGHAPAAQVSITVTPVNDPPMAIDDNLVVTSGETATIDVLANDVEPDGDPLNITDVTQPDHGVTTIDNNRIIFAADSDYTGEDVFSYTVNDGTGYEATGVVHVTIQAAISPQRAVYLPIIDR